MTFTTWFILKCTLPVLGMFRFMRICSSRTEIMLCDKFLTPYVWFTNISIFIWQLCDSHETIRMGIKEDMISIILCFRLAQAYTHIYYTSIYIIYIIYIYIYIFVEGARGVIVIVVGNEHDDTSSKSWTRLIAFHIALIPLGNYSPSSYG